jgi:hypothetical protein
MLTECAALDKLVKSDAAARLVKTVCGKRMVVDAAIEGRNNPRRVVAIALNEGGLLHRPLPQWLKLDHLRRD